MTGPINLSDAFPSGLHINPALTSNSDQTLKALGELAKTGTTDASSKSSNDAKAKEAREAANKFEALLIHNMLKSMRKTTLAEDTSNAKAIYDDMLDERLAETMIKAGGLGIADQIVAQIREQQGTQISSLDELSDKHRLLELANQLQRPSELVNTDDTSRRNTLSKASEASQLSMATNLWGNKQPQRLAREQQEFIQPLLPHAQRNATRLGTSPTAILAIAALETGWGRSQITDSRGRDSNNLFGIKASRAENDYATTLTTEYIEGNPQKLEARFKTYPGKAEAVDGFADFILSNPRYSKALQHAADPEQFLTELQNAGYATDPRYAEKAISIMHKLTGNMPPL